MYVNGLDCVDYNERHIQKQQIRQVMCEMIEEQGHICKPEKIKLKYKDEFYL